MHIKKVTFLSILVLAFYSCKKDSVTSADNFVLEITIDKIADGTKILLKKQEDNRTITIDSTFAKDQSFEFSGTVDIPTIYGIFIDSVKGGIFPLMENGTIRITAYRDSLYASKISGSKLNDELNNFREEIKKIASKIDDLFPEVQKARVENDSEKLEALNKRMQAVNDEDTRFTLNYARENPDSYVSAMVLQSLLRKLTINKDSIEHIYTNFSDKVKQSDYSKNIANFIEINTQKKDSVN